MQIVRYVEAGKEKIGFLIETKIYECRMIDPNLPCDAIELARKWDRYRKLAELTYGSILNDKIKYTLLPVRVTDVEHPELIDLTKL
jgi:hypothetical protein